MERIEEQYQPVKSHVKKVRTLFENDDTLPEALQSSFAIMEICANLLKDLYNNVKIPDHKAITHILEDMRRRGKLQKDYSSDHENLAEYKINAYYGEYSREPKPLPPKSLLKKYLNSSLELFEEVKPQIEVYIEKHKKRNKKSI